MAEKRLGYIDCIKGICVICVLLRHVPYALGFADNPYMDTGFLKNYYLPFFMPAFFFVTGYCSTFNTKSTTFLIKSIKTIVIPSFLLYYINRYLSNVNVLLFSENHDWMTFRHWVSPALREYISSGGHYWFLSALFFSKIIFFYLEKITKTNKIEWIIILLIACCGILLNGIVPECNFFFIYNAFALLPFMALGRRMKESGKDNIVPLAVSLPSYLLIVSLFVTCNWEGQLIPNIGRTIDFPFLYTPIYLVSSFFGVLLVLDISRRISSKILEYIGKASLVIYAFNWPILRFTSRIVVELLHPQDRLVSVLTMLIVVLLSLMIQTTCYWLINKRYTKFIIGKW